MRVAHETTSLVDAQRTRNVLQAKGIPAYIAAAELQKRGVLSGMDLIRVMVDNHAEEWRKREEVTG